MNLSHKLAKLDFSSALGKSPRKMLRSGSQVFLSRYRACNCAGDAKESQGSKISFAFTGVRLQHEIEWLFAVEPGCRRWPDWDDIPA